MQLVIMQMQEPFYSKLSASSPRLVGGAAAAVIGGKYQNMVCLSTNYVLVSGRISKHDSKQGNPLFCVFRGEISILFLKKRGKNDGTTRRHDGTHGRAIAWPLFGVSHGSLLLLALCLFCIVPRGSLKNRQRPCRSIWTA